METIMTNDFGERIKGLIFALGKNQTTFASSIGLTQAAISKTTKGESMPRYSFIDSIIKVYPNVNRDWLLEGKGDMFKKEAGGYVDARPDAYLMEAIGKIEGEWKRQLEVKDKLIETMSAQISQLIEKLGKLEGVSDAFVLQEKVFFEPLPVKYGYTRV